MKRIQYLIVIGFIFIVVPFANAGDVKLAKKLVEIQQYGKMFDDGLASCLDSVKKMSPTELYENDHRYFGGISPGSKYWKEIEKLYEEYYIASCDYVKIDEFINFFVKRYAKDYSNSELTKLIEFYSSELGQKNITSYTKANADFQNEAYAKMSENMIETNKIISKKIEKIINDYHQEMK